MLIRETTLADIAGCDRIRQATEPWHVATVAMQEKWFAANQPEVKIVRVCARLESGGDLVAFGSAKLDLYADEPGMASVSLAVHPDAQSRGIGTELYARLEAHLRAIGARRVQAGLMDQPESVRFAHKHGYVLGATDRFIVIDPRELPPMPAFPPGVTVVPMSESGPEPVYRVANVAARDEPADVPYAGMPYEDWLTRHWSTIDQGVSMIAFVDGEPASATALLVNDETGRATSAGTDTLREFRGRGLAKLIKSVSLRAAAERGVTAAFTSNNEVNAPMRAVNAWLGYRYVGARRSSLLHLAPAIDPDSAPAPSGIGT